jgi:hypothetical protein
MHGRWGLLGLDAEWPLRMRRRGVGGPIEGDFRVHWLLYRLEASNAHGTRRSIRRVQVPCAPLQWRPKVANSGRAQTWTSPGIYKVPKGYPLCGRRGREVNTQDWRLVVRFGMRSFRENDKCSKGLT